jgi:predicted dehydrogenase
MKFALLGWNSKIAPLLRAICADSRHSFTIATEVPNDSLAELLAAASGIRVLQTWEELLVDTAADVTLVAGGSDSIQAGAKQLAADGRTLALFAQASQGSAFIYELTLTHDDNRVPLVPVPRLPVHPLVEQLQEVIQRGDLGKVVLQRVERSVTADAQQSGRQTSGLTRDEVDGALFDDAPLLRFLGGNYNRITAVHSGSEETGITLATVTLGGNDLAEATWTARTGKPVWSLEVTGSTGSATLELHDGCAGTLTINSSSSDSEPGSTITDDGSRIGENQLAALEQSLEDSAKHWAEITRAFETVEATHTSLRRRRTIDLFFETTSERSIFKSQMTAVGCGLIMLTLFGLVAFLLLGAFVDSNSRLQRNAEADNRIIRDSEFVAGTAQLNKTGLKHVSEISREVQQSAETIFVMPDSQDSDGIVNEGRIASVVKALVEAGHSDSAAFVKVASVPHPATQMLLKVLRFLWIAPLLLFLLLQSLLFVTRPSSNETAEEE